MHPRFEQFRACQLGQQLESMIDTPERYIAFRALSQLKIPAVAALIHDLRSYFPDVEHNYTAKQFCGSMVAEVMRRNGHVMVREKVRVPGGYFTYAALWSPDIAK